MVFNCRRLFNEAAYLAALRRLRSPFAIRDSDSKQSKTKIYDEKKNHLWLRISAVIGRYGPHLMIVMIFVTQNKILNGPGISDRLLGFYPSVAITAAWFGLQQSSSWPSSSAVLIDDFWK